MTDWANARTSAVSHCCDALARGRHVQSHPAGEAAAVRRAVRVLARGREHDVRDALDAVHVGDLRVRADHRDALVGVLAEVRQQLLDQRDLGAVVSCDASVSAGSSTGWWAKTMTFLTAGSVSASSSAAWNIGSCAQSVPRSVP